MALVILGKEDLDVLEEWARTSFAEVNMLYLVRYFTVVILLGKEMSIDRHNISIRTPAGGVWLVFFPGNFLESSRTGKYN